MGISSVNNPDAKIEVVPDCEQRARTPSSPHSEITPLTDLQNTSKNLRLLPKSVSLITRRYVAIDYLLAAIDP